jgi:hypothetical protein
MALIKGKDYFVIGNLGKFQREPVRQWMKENNKVSPVVAEEAISANDYRTWIKTQIWPIGPK